MAYKFILLPPSLVWSTPLGPSWAMWHMHAPTFNKCHKEKKKKKKKKVTLHILDTRRNARVWVDFFGVCINEKNRDKKGDKQ